MNRPLQLLRQSARFCGSSALAFALWTVWLGLALLLVLQVYVASTNEFEVPGFLLRGLEERLAVSGIRATFGRTTFDPTGRLLLEDVRLSLPAFAEPVVAVRALYTRLDPWALALGRFEPREVRVTGASLSVPAMLSPTGRADPILSDLDAAFVPHEQELTVSQFSGRVAGIVVAARGAVRLPRLAPTAVAPLPVGEFLARNFSGICRQLVAAAERLSVLDRPVLDLELAPSDSRLAIASATLFARGLKLERPLAVQVSGLRAETRFPLFGDSPVTTRLEITASELLLPLDTTARNARISIRGILRPGQFAFEPLAAELSAGSLNAAGVSAGALAARLSPGPLPRLGVDAVAQIMGAPLAGHAEVDLEARTADVRFAGAIASAVLGPLGARLHLDVRKYFDFRSLECAEGEAHLGPGWKFEKLSARVALRDIDAYDVRIDEGRAVIELAGHHVHAPEAWARLGDNFARGSYDQDLATLDYRFLLEGRLRPLDIAGWFRSGWWSRFFGQFEFPAGPPAASADVSGRWKTPGQSRVFVYADAAGPVIRGGKFDRVHTLLFIRPAFYDGLEVFGAQGGGTARGTFTYVTDPVTFTWRSLDLDLTSSIDPTVAGPMIGPVGVAIVAPFKFAQPPALKLHGRLDGPAAPGGPHQDVRIEARSPGEFRFHDFPLDNVTFTAAVQDNDITVDNLHAGFAGGVATGRAKVSGVAAARRVRFDFVLKDASLGRLATTVQEFMARRKNAPPPTPGKFVKERTNVRLDLTAAAEGRYDDPLSYQGDGTAVLQGAEIGEVPLLGLLSEVLKFTALRFNTARTSFKIDGARLVFPDFNLHGANSAVDAHGEYALDRGNLDFKAKIFPFHESGNLIKTVVGAVLAPLSEVFEVSITGPLDKPSFALAVGSTSSVPAPAPGPNPPAVNSGESAPSTPSSTAAQSDAPKPAEIAPPTAPPSPAPH